MTSKYSQLDSEEVLSRCAANADGQIWSEFICRFHPLVVSVAQRTARRYTPAAMAVCEDLAQEVYLKLSAEECRLLRGFVCRHPGSAYGFLKVVTANVVHDYFRTKGRGRLEEAIPENISINDDLDWRVMEREIHEALARHATAAECQVFWLYYRQGMTAQEIAGLPFGLSAKGIESMLMRLKLLIREELAGASQPGTPTRFPVCAALT